MSLIVTHFSRNGIVHGTDSYVVRHDGTLADSSERKLFRLPGLRGAVAVAGNWNFLNEDGTEEFLSEWMPRFIEVESKRPDYSLRTVARDLATVWTKAIPPKFRIHKNWAHIAGYTKRGNRYHPEFWAVTNNLPELADQPDFDYSKVHYWEDFSTRDCHINRRVTEPYEWDLFEEFRKGVTYIYMNGDTAGQTLIGAMDFLRSSFKSLGPIVLEFASNDRFRTPFGTVVLDPSKPPIDSIARTLATIQPARSLSEAEEYVRESLKLIAFVFENAGQFEIGGEPEVVAIDAPKNVITSCKYAPIYTDRVIIESLEPAVLTEPQYFKKLSPVKDLTKPFGNESTTIALEVEFEDQTVASLYLSDAEVLCAEPILERSRASHSPIFVEIDNNEDRIVTVFPAIQRIPKFIDPSGKQVFFHSSPSSYLLDPANPDRPLILTVIQNAIDGREAIWVAVDPTHNEIVAAAESAAFEKKTSHSEIISFPERREARAAAIGKTGLVEIFAKSRAEEEFEEIKKLIEEVPFDYPNDCCHARAHKICAMLAERGFKSRKIWNFAGAFPLLGLCVSTPHVPDGIARWCYHVAVLISVRTNSHAEDRVLDPALFDRLATIDEWKQRQGDPTSHHEITDKQVYIREPNLEDKTDDDLSLTEESLKVWRELRDILRKKKPQGGWKLRECD